MTSTPVTSDVGSILFNMTTFINYIIYLYLIDVCFLFY